jgi:hypothetical protein
LSVKCLHVRHVWVESLGELMRARCVRGRTHFEHEKGLPVCPHCCGRIGVAGP